MNKVNVYHDVVEKLWWARTLELQKATKELELLLEELETPV